jgi:iron complex transport system permease protein
MFLILAILSAVIIAAVPFLGGHALPLSDVVGIFKGAPRTPGARIFWDIRAPRVLLAFVVGASLSVCGMSFQAMFRNPLATPFTLGVSGGAAFGAVAAIKLGLNFSYYGFSTPQFFAFLGALASIFIVYGIASAKKGFTVATMLLTGVAMSFFFSALIMFIQYASDFAHSFAMTRWMMGNLAVVGYKQVFGAAVFAGIGLLLLFTKRSDMNLLMTGDELAAGRGVDVDRSRRVVFFAVSIACGATVAVCGPIGFVGLIIPHVMRLIVGADHFDLAPACLLGGGIFLVVCDTFARMIILPAEVPIGIVTAMLGGPFFIWLLIRNPN